MTPEKDAMEKAMADRFRVALTRDILDSRGEPAFGRGALEILERAGDEVIFAARNARHGHDVEPATQRALRLQRLEA